MNTKIVYVVASLDDDIYMEQAIVSAWSVRHYNPDCHIEMVCDQDTLATLDSGIRAQYKSLFSKINVREFQPEQSMMERSRWMKTSLRQIIEGDYLYLDTDTVVCAELSYIDNFDFELGIVRDINCELKDSIFLGITQDRYYSLYHEKIELDDIYYNSGVIYAKDTKSNYIFWENWHNLWKQNRHTPSGIYDQAHLYRANKLCGNIVHTMDDRMNCQVIADVADINEAYIMHFFNNHWTKNNIVSPLLDEQFYYYVKKNWTSQIEEIILHCKTNFKRPSVIVDKECFLFYFQYNSLTCLNDSPLLVRFLKKISKHHFLLRIIELHLRIIYKLKLI